jgi:predicted transcriptional regulator
VEAQAALGPLESRLFEIVWGYGRAVSVRELQPALGDLAYTTVMTTVDRLYKKGLLDRRKAGRAYEYSPRLSPGELRQRLVQRMLARFLAASPESAVPLLSSLVETVGETDRALLEELERLVNERREQLRRKHS